jgi:hypothetical protein
LVSAHLEQRKTNEMAQLLSLIAKARKNIKPLVRWITAQRQFEWLARFGYAAKGMVYFVVGLLAAQAAIGSSQRKIDTSGALRLIVIQPLGKMLLSIITVGLIGYVLWRLVQTVFDPESAHQGMNVERMAQRVGYAMSGLGYAGVARTAVELIFDVDQEDFYSAQDWTALLLVQPLGQWLVGLVGAFVIGVGCSFLYYAYKGNFRQKFKQHQMTPAEQTWTIYIGKFGITARGIVFVMIGAFLIQAALQSDADRARGLSGALKALSQQPLGAWLLGLVALGLMAYSVYSLIEARYRRIVSV